MLTAIVLINLGCLALLLAALWQSRQALPSFDAEESFASLLAQAAPVAPAHAGRKEAEGADARAPVPVTPRDERPRILGKDARGRNPATAAAQDATLVAEIGLANRLGIVRLMLRGQPAEAAAAAFGIPLENARALYRLHGREEDETGMAPGPMPDAGPYM